MPYVMSHAPQGGDSRGEAELEEAECPVVLETVQDVPDEHRRGRIRRPAQAAEEERRRASVEGTSQPGAVEADDGPQAGE